MITAMRTCLVNAERSGRGSRSNVNRVENPEGGDYVRILLLDELTRRMARKTCPKGNPRRQHQPTTPRVTEAGMTSAPGVIILGPVSTCHTARQQLSESALTTPSGTSLAPLPGGLKRLRRHKRQFGSEVEQIAKRFALNSPAPLPTRLGMLEVLGLLALLE
jgi:hypothetical protein